MRRIAICLLVLIPFSVAACSSDSDSDDSASADSTADSGSDASADPEAYCDAIQAGLDLLDEAEATGEVASQEEFQALLAEAQATAPPEVARAYSASLTSGGRDADATETINAYNLEECGLDTTGTETDTTDTETDTTGTEPETTGTQPEE